MVFHFRRLGQPTGWMLTTAFLAAGSGVLQIVALERRSPCLPATAVILYGVSLGVFWWAVAVTRGKLAACGQSCVSRTVVRQGPYRWIRHPFYAVYNLTWLAGLVAWGWWPLALSAAVMGYLYERFARDEETGFLKSPLAEEYRRYMRQAGRYVPRMRGSQ